MHINPPQHTHHTLFYPLHLLAGPLRLANLRASISVGSSTSEEHRRSSPRPLLKQAAAKGKHYLHITKTGRQDRCIVYKTCSEIYRVST